MGIIQKCYNFFNTPKREDVLLRYIEEVCPESKKKGLKKLCPTRLSVSDHNLNTWHRRFGHLNKNTLLELFKNKIVDGLPTTYSKELGFCGTCVKAKFTRLPYPSYEKQRSRRPLELIHSDVCGPVNPVTYDGYKYFVSFIDDFTHFVSIFLLKQKSEVLECFKKFKLQAETQFKSQIARLRVDNGGEHTSNDFKDFCTSTGIKIEFTIPHNPQQNGVSERFNRSLLIVVNQSLYGVKPYVLQPML